MPGSTCHMVNMLHDLCMRCLSSKSYETVLPVKINMYNILLNSRGFRGMMFYDKAE